ncbi:MAG TPA: AI-2E family transporter [Pyrinomonadaceae bacterium]|nr:AI-2E family transporter [Pyrinomonadaceae bacterium]
MAEQSISEQRTERRAENKEMAQTAAVAVAEATWPQARAILRIIFIVLAVAAVVWIVYALQGVLLLVVLSVFFAYLIAPLVEMLRRPFEFRRKERVMPRAIAIGIVYVVLFGLLTLSTTLLYPLVSEQVTQFVQQVPGYVNKARTSDTAKNLNRVYQRFPPATREVIDRRVSETAESMGQNALNVAAWVAYLPWFVLIPILAFFFLKDADSFRRSALQMLPHGRIRWRGDEFFQDVNSTLAAYIRAQLIASLLIGIICTIAFYLIGINYALALGVLAGVLEFIPLVGPLTVAVIVTSVAGFDSANRAIVILIFLFVLRIVQDYVLYPRIIGSGIHLHPLAVILAILCGHELAGIAGIFLAIPVIAIITVTYRHWLEHRGSEGLVADLLKPAEEAVTAPSSTTDTAPAPVPVEQQ